MRATTFALAVLAVLAAGCARKHITPAFGLATQATYGMQQVKAAKPPPPNMALDTQEAEVIGKSYVRSLSGKTAAAEPEPVLYLSPQRQGAPARLAPSVPKE
jgi:hypothetical protein